MVLKSSQTHQKTLKNQCLVIFWRVDLVEKFSAPLAFTRTKFLNSRNYLIHCTETQHETLYLNSFKKILFFLDRMKEYREELVKEMKNSSF